MTGTKGVLQYLGVFIVLLIYMTLLIFAQLSFQTTVEDENLKLWIALAMGILFPYIIYVLNRIYFKKMGLNPPQLLKINWKLLKNIGIGLLLGLLALYLSGLLFYFQTKDFNNLLFKISFPLVVFNILTAIGEEIIFRGTLLNFFAQKNKRYVGLIISAIVFALIHLLNVLMGQEVSMSHIVTLALAGLFLGLIYLNFGLVSAIATHYIWNLLHAGSNFSEEGYTVQSVLFILCLGLFYLDMKNQKLNNKTMPAHNSV